MRHLLLLSLMSTALFAADTPKPPQRIWEPPFFNGAAAQVGKVVITYDDIRREMAPLAGQVRQQSSSAADYNTKMGELYQQTLNGLVERQLLITEFNTKGYKVPPKDADMEYRRILKENFDGKVSDLIASLQAQGLTLPAYRQRLTENMMAAALQSRFRNELPDITPQQVAMYYQAHQNKFAQDGSVKLAVITLKPMTDEPVSVLQQQGKDVAEKAKSGTDFDTLAQTYNEEGSANWDWLSNSDLAEEVKAAVANLKVGDTSGPILLEGPKVLVIKLLDRKNDGVAGLDEVRDDIKKTLFEQQAKDAYARWMEQLRKKYFVQING